jgi:hypothetical protein
VVGEVCEAVFHEVPRAVAESMGSSLLLQQHKRKHKTARPEQKKIRA